MDWKLIRHFILGVCSDDRLIHLQNHAAEGYTNASLPFYVLWHILLHSLPTSHGCYAKCEQLGSFNCMPNACTLDSTKLHSNPHGNALSRGPSENLTQQTTQTKPNQTKIILILTIIKFHCPIERGDFTHMLCFSLSTTYV